MCAASCILSVLSGVDSYGKEARVATAPPGTATNSFAGAVRTAKNRSDLLSAAYVRMAGQEQRKWL